MPLKQSNEMLTALAQHKERRRREQLKVTPAPLFPEWRNEELTEKYRDEYDSYGNWKDDYANSVGISRDREL